MNEYPRTSRNARIARLKLYASWPLESADIQTNLLLACQEHFDDFSSKDVCYHDLFPHVPYLNQEHQANLLGAVSQYARSLMPGPDDSEVKLSMVVYMLNAVNANLSQKSQAVLWIISETNVLKLVYYLCISKEPTKLDKGRLGSFVCRCLRLYSLSLLLCPHLPVSERRPADDAALLATMTLVHIAELGEAIALLRSTVILESLLDRSRHNYDALLIQIRLYLNLGMSSSAMERYVQLSVKNMQQATISWILYTQISMLHPYPYVCKPSSAKAPPTMDLWESITSALDWHATAGQVISDSTSAMLRESQYNMPFDALELAKLINMGFTKLVLMVEWSRIQRLTNAPSQKDYLDILS